MANFFDSMVMEVLPSLRAAMAKKLLENGFSQREVGDMLGLTQPAISQYKRNARGYRKDLIENNPKLIDGVNSLTRRMASGQVSSRAVNLELLDICKGILE